MLSAVVWLVSLVVRPRAARTPVLRMTPPRLLAALSGLVGIGFALRDRPRERGATVCEDERGEGLVRCARYEDQGYAACARYEDHGYSACSRYEDHGYNSCREWRKNCCDWWPCSWVCEVFSWFCYAWVWVSHWVCVAWTWITHLVCVLWIWITRLVCVAWVFTGYGFCVLLCWLKRRFTGNEVSESKSECIYGWTEAWRATEESDCRIDVVVRVRLQPDAGITTAQVQAVQAAWEPVVERAWTDQFPLRLTRGGCSCERYTVSLDLQWVTSGEHHVVQLHAGSGRADMGNFFLNNTGQTIAHEVGHMLGNPDEYADPACPGRTVTSDGSIMQNSQTGTVRQRHYQGFADWISARTCCTYEVAAD